MADIFAILTGVAATIQQCINLSQSIRGAINSRKNLCNSIREHEREAIRTSGLINRVKDEESLHTPDIIRALQDVDEAGKKLNNRLSVARANLKKSNIRLVGGALFPNPEEEKRLQAEFKELELAKDNLNHCIILHNIGLSQDINNNIKSQATSINRLNRAIKVLSTRGTLRTHNMTGTKEETEQDMFHDAEERIDEQGESTPASSTGDTPSPSSPTQESATKATSTAFLMSSSSRAVKIVEDNNTTDSSMMFNGPVSEEESWNGANVAIQRNTSSKDSTMFNYSLPQKFILEMARIRSGGGQESKVSSFSFLKRHTSHNC
ncbi:hypothetical protein F5Y04DRAFT_241709 [Hypomontagnella monticulosa]|nr:hypothetical protein F5Y04DRAFT_241709 [Hypomontagnella monticulosa]